LFGLVPALQTAKRDLVDPLRDSGKGTSGGFRRRRLTSALVVGEGALALVLLAGAGLLMRTFVNLTTVDLGFDPSPILSARVPLPKGRYETRESRQQFFTALLDRIKALPGVEEAATSIGLPPFGGVGGEVEVAGKVHDDRWNALMQFCSEGYFATLGLRLQEGRLLSADDVAAGRHVIVVNRTFADRYLGPGPALGHSVRFKLFETLPPADRVGDPVFEVVGVVADVRNHGIQERPDPETFIPYTVTSAFSSRGLLVRTSLSPAALQSSLR